MFKSLKNLLVAASAPTPAAPGQRRARRSWGDRRAPLPEVSEVDWSEWESSVLHSELDALFAESAPSPPAATGKSQRERATASELPEVREVDWSEWEDSVLGDAGHPGSRPKRPR